MSTNNSQNVIVLTAKQLEVYKITLNELAMLNIKWSEYQFLYSTKAYQQRVKEVAPTFFFIHQQSLIRDILHTLSRLHDPASSGSDENCSLLWLANDLPASAVKQSLNAALKAIKPKMAKFKTWRNKMGSHNDYAHISSLAPNTPLFNLSDLGEVIKLTSEAFNIVASHESRKQTAYPFDIPVIKGAEALMQFMGEYIQAHRKHKPTS